MKKSKKGITLVELVICCAITVMLAGACTAVLISGQRVWNSGSKSANAQMTADVLQTNLYNRLTSINGAVITTAAKAKAPAAGEGSTLEGSFALYLDGEDDVFTMDAGGNKTTLEDVKSFSFSFTKAGAATSDSARAQFNYTATLGDGRDFSGGVVISNLKYMDITNPDETYTLTASGDGATDNSVAILFTKTSASEAE